MLVSNPRVDKLDFVVGIVTSGESKDASPTCVPAPIGAAVICGAKRRVRVNASSASRLGMAGNRLPTRKTLIPSFPACESVE